MAKPWLAHYEAVVRPTLTYPAISLAKVFDDSAHQYANRPALHLVLRYAGPLALGGRLTYAQLHDQVNRFAAALHGLGVRKGDRVALMLPNLPQFVIGFFGVTKLGAIVVNTNPLYTARELEHQFVDTGTETVVLLSGHYAKLAEVQSGTAVKRVLVTDITDYTPVQVRLAAARTLRRDGLMSDVPASEGVYHFRQLLDATNEAPPQVEVASEEVAILQPTGGTTGIPKSAMLTHRNLVVNVLQLMGWMPSLCRGRERFMGALPLFHVYGMTVVMLCGVYLGAEITLLPSPRPILNVMVALQREKCTFYPGVPAMYSSIINHPDVKKYNFRSIKACLSAAAPLPMEVQVKFGEITGGRLVEGYGLSEAAPCTHANPVFGERRSGSIGLPVEDVEAKIVDPDTLVELPIDQPGELWIRGPQVMAGYWNKPEETARTLTSDGWLRTGDIARMDADGYFYIVDRLKDLIIVSGFNVVPREVEEVLYAHPKIQEAVVAGVPDVKSGEMIKAYLVLKPGETATADEIIAYCRQHLAPYKVPHQIEFRAELPKTLVGKYLRRVLIEEEKQKQRVSASV
jgi:long-chain acyl-CoA synthetase